MNTVLTNHQNDAVLDAERAARKALGARLKRALATLRDWVRRHESRSRLRTELIVMNVTWIEKDLGLTPGTLRREASKPFWKE
ncbi:hypothetical protein [Saccharospirillum mangrovi]|uniref:hypothetical protein n=1 Tax=Saccharospirillum mangrovi TaxID=2161747 RepID=UPI000D36B88F|nr:hypothetical protein [Saccharospirillum mangrovi]